MSYQITIKAKTIFRKKINFSQLVNKLELDYGAYDNFSILVKNKFYNENQTILFNPKRIGLGIFFDGFKMNKGTVVLIIQSLSTLDEIEKLYDIVGYINDFYKKIDIYVNDEYITYGVFQTIKPRIQQLALDNLRLGCKRTLDYIYHVRMALFPLTLSEEIRDKFAYADDLIEFEEFIHNKQKDKIYYAKPDICKEDEKITAYYTLTENCKSIFPVNGNDYYNDKVVDSIFIKFCFISADKKSDKIYSYQEFISLFNTNDKYDDNHIYINEMSFEEIENTIKKLRRFNHGS